MINNANRKHRAWDLQDLKWASRRNSGKQVKRASNRWARRLLDQLLRQETTDALAVL